MQFIDTAKGFRHSSLSRTLEKHCQVRMSTNTLSNSVSMSKVCVNNDKMFSEPFLITHVVKQGCGMTRNMFTLIISAMLLYAFQCRDTGFLDGKSFNLLQQVTSQN